MSLYMVYCSWPGETMNHRQIRQMMVRSAAELASRQIACQEYWGTHENGEGWMTLSAPNRDALVRALCDLDVPFLCVTQVWHVAADDLNIEIEAGAEAHRI